MFDKKENATMNRARRKKEYKNKDAYRVESFMAERWTTTEEWSAKREV